MDIDLRCSKELALRLRLKPAVRIPYPNTTQAIYEREKNSIMISTGKGMFVWPLLPSVREELKNG